ncbi:hypothetical protein DEO72_LG2g4181 [Vigna unguiculata]|uniref:Uncharacterized protein n=1 Tax=Vigna unguiculata TaxID=3917 RepID=A0A4D6L5X2_VIGUN|nr:hypothetical protein DEO72_LG2g4181 [Vigna unguiculata]
MIICDAKWSSLIRTTVRISPKTTKLVGYNRGGKCSGTHPYEQRSRTLHLTSKTTRLQSRVAMSYSNTSYTHNWGPNKESHQNLHPKLCRTLHVVQLCTWNSQAPHIALLGAPMLQAAWRAPYAARRHAPSKTFVSLPPPGETTPFR